MPRKKRPHPGRWNTTTSSSPT